MGSNPILSAIPGRKLLFLLPKLRWALHLPHLFPHCIAVQPPFFAREYYSDSMLAGDLQQGHMRCVGIGRTEPCVPQRWIMIALVVAVAAVAALIGQELLYKSGITVATSIGPPCPDGKPVHVSLLNEFRARKVNRVDMTVTATEPGRSTDWLADGRAYSDIVLLPGQSSEACLSFEALPRAPAGLVYTATVAKASISTKPFANRLATNFAVARLFRAF